MTSLLRTISYSVIRSTRRSLCANHQYVLNMGNISEYVEIDNAVALTLRT